MSAPRSMRLVVVESPYAGKAPGWAKRIPGMRWAAEAWVRWRHVRYARAAVRDCILRGEAPIASHLLLTQPGILRDHVPGERRTGIEAGLAWGDRGDLSAFYVNEGTSNGMRLGAEWADRVGRAHETRTVPGWRRCPFLWRLTRDSAWRRSL